MMCILKVASQHFSCWLMSRRSSPLLVLPLAACVSTGTGDGQSAFETALSTVSRNVAPILKEVSPELGAIVERLDTSPEKQIELAEAGAREIEQQHPRVGDPKLEAHLTQM